jgi:hypothetical protein
MSLVRWMDKEPLADEVHAALGSHHHPRSRVSQ